MVKSSKKQSAILGLFQKHKVLCILTALILAGAVLTGVISITRYIDHQQDIKQLNLTSTLLRGIYDELIASNRGAVSSSYFQSVCGESSVEIGQGQVRCGPSGYIELNKKEVLEDEQINTKNLIEKVSGGRNVDVSLVKKNTSIYGGTSYTMDFALNEDSCLLTHAITERGVNMYTLDCRKLVSDFLPGYTIKQ